MDMVKTYFNAEKYESVFFVVFGVVAFALALYFMFSQKTPFYRGMAIPLAVVALIQITVGTTVWMRSPKDISRVEQLLTSTPTKIQTEEVPRMEVVMKNFLVYRYVEIALLVLALVLMFVVKDYNFTRGIAIGLFIQSALMLALDFFAEMRGEEYLQYLKGLGN